MMLFEIKALRITIGNFNNHTTCRYKSNKRL